MRYPSVEKLLSPNGRSGVRETLFPIECELRCPLILYFFVEFVLVVDEDVAMMGLGLSGDFYSRDFDVEGVVVIAVL